MIGSTFNGLFVSKGVKLLKIKIFTDIGEDVLCGGPFQRVAQILVYCGFICSVMFFHLKINLQSTFYSLEGLLRNNKL